MITSSGKMCLDYIVFLCQCKGSNLKDREKTPRFQMVIHTLCIQIIWFGMQHMDYKINASIWRRWVHIIVNLFQTDMFMPLCWYLCVFVILTDSPFALLFLVKDGAHSCCFHPDGNIVAIGTQTARWVVLDLATREIVSVHTDGNEQIECVQFSPGKFG